MIYPISASVLSNGSLSIMAKPDCTDLSTTFSAIKSSGITHLVSLLEEAEANALGLATEADWCERFQIEFFQFPIADFSTPASYEQFAAFTQGLCRQIHHGGHTLIHCRGGIGRAGMTASSVLVHAGLTAYEAMAVVSKSRGESVPETDEQIALVQRIEAEMKS